MSINGTTGALIVLSIAVSLLLAFSITIALNWHYTNLSNKTLEQRLEQVKTEIDNKTVVVEQPPQQPQPQQNITQLLDDYESNKVTRSLKAALDAFTDEDNLKDLCSLWGSKESNTNLTQIWKNTWDAECLVQPTPAPTPQPTPTPVPPVQPTPTPVPPKPTPTPVPPVQTCNTDEIFNATTNECQAKPAPQTPVPTPTGALKVAVVGDVKDSSAGNLVYNQIKRQNPDEVMILGDLGYEADLSWFKSTYGTMGDKLWCVMGNHEADNEDGSAALDKETKEFCGNSYWIKRGATMFFMLNTNEDDFKNLIIKTGEKLSNQTLMKGIKTLHILTHKPCAVPPNSNHQVEPDVKLLCDAIKFKIPTDVRVFYTNAHNHVMSESNDKTYKQSGAGGRSHYTCGTNTAFPFCSNVNYGFLIYTIQPDGQTTSQFIDYNGRVIR